MDENIISTPTNTITSDATRAVVVGAAQIVGSTLGVAIIIGAVYGVDRVKTAISNRKTKKNQD